jgi:glycosyltransferase involved in cell wall biosynthesis
VVDEQAAQPQAADGVELPGRALRILDLGGHDGFVSAYVADQLAGQGAQLHIDGVELNPKGCQIANRRLRERGVTGTFKQGLAEHAPELFDVGTYDAVVAFELIEHVIDMDGFLDAAEAMLVPDGRVYISTPDGTFGAGQNPNHLRVLRVIDLVALVRRRGNVQGAIVGQDTIGVVAYTPEPQRVRHGELAIYLGPGIKHWSPLDIERPGVGLGGSETAAVRLAEAMDKLGYAVTVYAEVEQGAFGQVLFRHHSTFDPLEPRRALICSRTPHLFDRPVDAPARVLWMHDTDYGPAMSEERLVHASAVMVLSEWHRGHVASLYPFVADRLIVTGNAIQPAYFGTDRPAEVLVNATVSSPELGTDKLSVPNESDDVNSKMEELVEVVHGASVTAPTHPAKQHRIEGVRDLTRSPSRAIYSSSPDRGLDFLVDIWPDVRAKVPDAELVCCYADVYDAAAAARPELQAFRDRLAAAIADTEGVFNLGSLAQPELASTMERCGVWLNPGWNGVYNVPFNETYCIGAVEAAAAGCAIVAADHGALPERMEVAERWNLVHAKADGSPDRDLWTAAITDVMRCEQEDPSWPSEDALQVTWDRVAQDFHAVIERHQG